MTKICLHLTVSLFALFAFAPFALAQGDTTLTDDGPFHKVLISGNFHFTSPQNIENKFQTNFQLEYALGRGNKSIGFGTSFMDLGVEDSTYGKVGQEKTDYTKMNLIPLYVNVKLWAPSKAFVSVGLGACLGNDYFGFNNSRFFTMALGVLPNDGSETSLLIQGQFQYYSILNSFGLRKNFGIAGIGIGIAF